MFSVYSCGSGMDIALGSYIRDYRKLLGLMQGCDGYISISAGEGWDQPLVEAMGLGVPVLVTRNTAHEQYCDLFNSTLINCRNEIAYDGIWFTGNKGKWYPPIDFESYFFNWVVQLGGTYLTDKGKAAKRDMKGYYSLKNGILAARLLPQLNEIK